MTFAIEVFNLRKNFNQFHLNDVSFTLPTGTIMGFVGENGAGKTTTIKCILNLLKKDSGTIQLFGLDAKDDNLTIKERIGVVFDDIHFPDMLSAQQINKFLQETYQNWDRQYYFDLLTQLKVPIHKPIKELSRGMKMKLSITIALAHHPQLLILDEPTSGLDPIVRDEILDLFLQFMQDENNSILFSSHITSDLEKIADYITFIHEGEILFSENKDVLLYELGIWKGSKEQALDLPSDAKIRTRASAFGVEILVKRNEVSSAFQLDQPTIEDIMLFFVKGVLI
ncbi:ABC-2 type transport system ATP-binding protein [Ureibacillus xyleni]|uniref:ABC-2 type transport system ATP-binding protein n=1 Tax=Ureibacillus xyleni TaxID=614648 RepID=A0A285RI58_9BACL|nr:ABC transporter ATP-binding protein [Ureibacillus xyleni]SOB93388.1 ABC-2 type transport system ATP-binding protein [Ureibacillus xyleni]